MKQYIPANQDLLYEAIEEQAEFDVQEALQREFPHMEETEHANLVNHWRRLCAKVEQKLNTGQGE